MEEIPLRLSEGKSNLPAGQEKVVTEGGSERTIYVSVTTENIEKRNSS